MPAFENYTDTVLNWTAGTQATDSKYIMSNADWGADANGVGTVPIGGWISEEKFEVLKWKQQFRLSLNDMMKGDASTTGAVTFNEKKFDVMKTGFFHDIQRRIMIGFEEEIIGGLTTGWLTTTDGSSATTMNVDVQPPPRRHGGIYKVRNRTRHSLHRPAAPEEKARRLLQRLVGFQRYARYIRDGFVTHRGASGRVYQIFPGQTHMRVWFKGQRVEDLCLCIEDYSIPPTDSVVMRLLMLEHSEAEFREQANISRVRTKTDQQIIDESIESIRAMAGQARALAG